MPYSRVMGDAVILCDGTIGLFGGAATGKAVSPGLALPIPQRVCCCGWRGGWRRRTTPQNSQAHTFARQPPACSPCRLTGQGWSNDDEGEPVFYEFKDGSTYDCEERCTLAHEPYRYEPTIFDPVISRWSAAGSQDEPARPRLYHSVHLLLPPTAG